MTRTTRNATLLPNFVYGPGRILSRELLVVGLREKQKKRYLCEYEIIKYI